MVEVEELALKSKGCVISYSSSSYDGYDECSKIIDGQRSTYWCTTGIYPQIFILTFPNPVIISSIKIRSYLVQLISVETCSAEIPQQFEDLCETELGITDHCHQVESLHETKFIARHLRFTVKSGYDHVCAVYRVEVQGIQNKSGEYEMRADETKIPEIVGQVTTALRQTALKSNLADGTGRLVDQSPRERGNRISSSMVPPLWNEEDEEGEEVVSLTGTNNRVARRDSDLSSDYDNHNPSNTYID